ncbi:MAG TPA: glycosyltransferase [Methanoregulaceae archaeon]|nr:glycosyltransferase [Methanoregulaceae archaeon]
MTMNPESELAVIIPTKNDEVTIGSLVLLARQMVNNVIVVDDLSQDRTPEIARYAGAEVLSVDSYGGSGRIYSILVGCRRALESGCRAVVLIDGQSEPLVHDIYRVASPVLSGKADLVIGSREFFGRKTIPPYSPDGIVNRGEILDDEYIFTSTDPDSRFRALSIEAISLLDLLPNSDQFESTMITLFSNRGLRIREVPIALKYERPRRGKGFLPHYREHRVGVVVPAYNEEQLIGETISGIPDFVANVYVVNDCSEDRTGEIIDYYATQDPSIIPIHHDTNRGVGAAIVSGYRRALEDGMQIIAVMAGDNQMDPRFLPDLLDPIVNGRCDYTMGNRLINPEFRKSMSLWRFGGNVILTLLTKIAAGYWQMVDPQNGYTAISSRALAQIPLDNLYPRYGYCNDLLVWLNIYGFRVINVPHPARYGLEKSKIRYRTYIIRVSGLLLRGFFRRLAMKYVVLSFHPLVFFFFIGLLFTLIGTLGTLYSLYISIFHAQSIFVAGISSLILLAVGLQCLLFALLFDMQQENKENAWY